MRRINVFSKKYSQSSTNLVCGRVVIIASLFWGARLKQTVHPLHRNISAFLLRHYFYSNHTLYLCVRRRVCIRCVFWLVTLDVKCSQIDGSKEQEYHRKTDEADQIALGNHLVFPLHFGLSNVWRNLVGCGRPWQRGRPRQGRRNAEATPASFFHFVHPRSQIH